MTALCVRTLVVGVLATALAHAASAVVVPPAGYIYSTQLLRNTPQGCIAAGPAGTFVGIGPGFTPNAQSIVLAKESGELRLVASGFNSLSDCAYDRFADVLYVTDNADNGDPGISGAVTGDTVFAIPSASTASGLSAPGLELLPPDSVPAAAGVAVDVNGDVFVGNAVGGGAGTVLKIVSGSPSTFIPALELAGGVAFNPANGNLFVAENLGLPDFQNRISQFTAAGMAVPPTPFAGPSLAFGSVDIVFNSDGRLLTSGVFGGDVVSFNPADGSSVPFVSGLPFASGMTVDPFTRRLQILSSTFSIPPVDDDKMLHRFTPVSQLTPGGGSSSSDCLHEGYGLQLVDGKATCVDGAPCDSDGAINDACLFPLGFCLNVADSDLAECTAATVTEVSIVAKPASAAITTAAAHIASALPLSGSTCFFSDGYYLPVKIAGSVKKEAKAKVKVHLKTNDDRKDSDTLKLVCQPAP